MSNLQQDKPVWDIIMSLVYERGMQSPCTLENTVSDANEIDHTTGELTPRRHRIGKMIYWICIAIRNAEENASGKGQYHGIPESKIEWLRGIEGKLFEQLEVRP